MSAVLTHFVAKGLTQSPEYYNDMPVIYIVLSRRLDHA